MQRNSREFKDLEAKWYAKLKKEGFVDIESKNGSLDTGKALNNIATNYTQESFALKQEYYQLVGQFLHSYPFKTKQDRLIWECHSENISIRNTTKRLKRKGYRTYKRKVHERLQFLIKEMRQYEKK